MTCTASPYRTCIRICSARVFAGKGILDVEAFWRSLEGRTPGNALLSHDLFEGIHGRAALATDITLLEDYPAHYLAHTRRQHRWVRGDGSCCRG